MQVLDLTPNTSLLVPKRNLWQIFYRPDALPLSVVVLGLEMSSRTNFESLALALKLKSLLTTVLPLAQPAPSKH